MRKLQKIVVGAELDLSGKELTCGAHLALDQARWLAKRFGARVTLVHSTARDESWDPRGSGYVLKEARDPAECAIALDGVARRFHDAGIRSEVVTSDEAAWIAITRTVLSEGSDLVVVGKRTGRGDKNRKLGSVTLNLFRKCPAVVWAVDPDANPSPEIILAATDLTPVGQRVLEIAASLAVEKDARLHVVHAFQMPLDIQMGGGHAQVEFERETRTEAEEMIRRQLGEAGCEKAETHLGLTSPTRAIMECVDRLEPDLVVMGTISRGGIPGVLVGNTAERLFARLDCSLLTVKPDEFICPLGSARVGS